MTMTEQETAQFAQIAETELELEGQAILAEAVKFIGRFSVLPSDAAANMLALFAAHTWIYRAFTETPRIHISALTYGAGKTRVMKLTSLLCANPFTMAKITGPAIYHIIPERQPAPLNLDEADAIFAPGRRSEDIRGILDAGYEESGVITRVVKGVATDFNVFCPVMFAGKGTLPESLADRSLTVMMRKRRRGEKMDRYIKKLHEADGRKIGLLLGSWATKIQAAAADLIWDDAPESLADRKVDILTPLYAIATMAGGDWPERFAEIVNVIAMGGTSSTEVSPAQELLSAISDVWPASRVKLATHELANLLAAHPSGAFEWPEKQRSSELSARLRDLGIAPEPVRIGKKVMRGYKKVVIESVTQIAA